MRVGGHRGGRRRGPNWGGLGCAVPVLLFALADPTWLPRPIVVAIGVAASVSIAGCLGLWSSLTGGMHRRVGGGLYGMLKDAALDDARSAFLAVADDLDRLLERQSPGSRYGVGVEFWRARQVLAKYNAELRDTASDAVNQARAFVSVPPAVTNAAERPRSVGELEYLRGWLRRMAEDLAAV